MTRSLGVAARTGRRRHTRRAARGQGLLAPADGDEVAADERLALDAPQEDHDGASQGQAVVDGGGAKVGRGGLDLAEVGVGNAFARHISNTKNGVCRRFSK